MGEKGEVRVGTLLTHQGYPVRQVRGTYSGWASRSGGEQWLGGGCVVFGCWVLGGWAGRA